MMKLLIISVTIAALGGCFNFNRDAQTAMIRQETKQGVEGGVPVNVVTITREQTQEQSQAQTTADVGATISTSINTAVAGLKGDLPGLIKAIIPEVKPVDFSPIMSRLDAKPQTDWATLASAGVAAIGAGGYGLIKHRESRSLKSEADEAWAQNQRALAMLPPDQANQILGAKS